MDQNLEKIKQQIKILIGVAWIDGQIKPEERQYIHRIAVEKGVAFDPAIHDILHELVVVTPNEVHGWINQYLGTQPTSSDYHNLIKSLKELIKSDGEIGLQEKRILGQIKTLEPTQSNHTLVTFLKELFVDWLPKQK